MVLAAASLAAVLSSCTRFGASLARPSDPVVLTGAALPKLLASDPMHIVGFAWDGGKWTQIPVQVDERDDVAAGLIYHLPLASYPTVFGTATPYRISVYTPPGTPSAGYRSDPTYTPPDSNPTFDADDELSLLADDTGRRAGASVADPAGVDSLTREEVRANDPLDAGKFGYVYLFHSDTLTGGSAGTTGVDYTFSLDSGAYKDTYKMGTGSLSPNDSWGFNPEHSTVVTPSYRLSLGDRWLNNGLAITHLGAPGTALLDRTHYYATAGCVRTEDTFDGAASNPGEGAFIANISGPVRAIRSYLGANSFKYTVNTDIYYPGREDTVTDVRGHAGLPGYGGADDFLTGVTGLTYNDPANTAIAIDGVPDAVTPITSTTGSVPPPSWQLVTGAQGSLITVRTIETDLAGLDVTTVYQDRNPASPAQCTGDAAAWGQNGMNITSPSQSVPATDPTLVTDPPTFVVRRFRYFRKPNVPISTAVTVDLQARNPIATVVTG